MENGRVDEAAEILQDIAGHKDANPNEHAYLPVLVSLVQDREYHRALELLKQGEERGVPFTSEVQLPTAAELCPWYVLTHTIVARRLRH